MINHLVVNDRIYCCIFTLYADAQQVLYRVQNCKFSHSLYRPYIYSLSLPKGKSAVVSTDLGVALTHTSTAGGPWLAVVICAV